MAIPEKIDYAIIGAGIHGLSTAWHLAAKLKAKGRGDGSKILVIDKSSIAAGASGVGVGSEVNRLNDELAMIAVVRRLREAIDASKRLAYKSI